MSSILYYSNYCEHSKKLLQTLSKANVGKEIHFICIDKRTKDANNKIFIVLENGQKIIMPENVNRVPALLLLNQGFNVLYGESILQLMFILMAAWTLVPDKVDDDIKVASQRGAFVATTIAFFFVEMGDKTQVATIALGAQYHAVWAVAAGTTLGMMIANVPAVFLGEQLVAKISLRTVHKIAAGLFLVLGLWQFWELSNPA